jgi:hypothetical protein
MATESAARKSRYCERPGCTNRLTGKQRRFCSNSCRATFANQQKTADKRALAESMALEEIREKLEPVTRELLTDEVLKQLNALTNLLPMAVAEIQRELAVDEDGKPLVEDSDVRQKAAMQLLKVDHR